MINVGGLNSGYENKEIIKDLSLNIKKGEIVSIIGPNGSGKSTLLKSIGRFLKINKGEILLCDENIKFMKSSSIAKILSMLSQHNSSPEDIKVKDLVYYGRIPHKKWYEARKKEDEEIVNWALENTGVDKYSERRVIELSGGEKQRVYLAMALAQKPKILLLDEPTTYLDMCHQLELMELIKDINKRFNMTILMVLHDLNQASRYSHRIIIMKQGKIVADGKPENVIKKDIIHEVYNVKCVINKDPLSNAPHIYPLEVCYKKKERYSDCEV
ncbi:MAG: ABC transporter ATP-binding protein [Clostridium perfringens]|nr:ABC transporter ATP-binding protein [Clostridium perfringens]